jgi:hypothetical protein
MLRIGEYRDPLAASWLYGLGRVTAWTSDASDKWSQQWASWPGYVGFWSALVKETFPSATGQGAVRASVANGRMSIRVESETAFPDGATAIARATGPDLQGVEVPLERVDDSTFVGETAASAAGSYAVGAQVVGADGVLLNASSLASSSYSPEYLPGEPDRAAMAQISEITGGRGEIDAAGAFTPDDLVSGTARVSSVVWLLLLAALLWPIAVAVSRLAFRGTTTDALADQVGRMTDAFRHAVPTRPGAAAPKPRAPRKQKRERYVDLETEERKKREAAPPETVGRLLDRQRERRGGAGDPSAGSGSDAGDD